MIIIGTSGYHYKDWAGVFYPEGTKKDAMLAFYAEHFPAVELNFTYYGIPKPSTFENMLAKTPPGFEFVVKANKGMTHESKEEDVFKQYRDAIAPLVESGRLGAVLAQFPWAFRNTPDNRNYIYYFHEQLPGVPLVVEFRNNTWQADSIGPQNDLPQRLSTSNGSGGTKPRSASPDSGQEVFDFLKGEGISCCCVDEPELRDLPDRRAVFTAEPAYVRFHSRDAGKWYAKGGKDRYNYLYSEEELAEWVPKVKDLAEKAGKVYVFFNNCHGAQAAQNARRLGELLELW